MTLKTHVDKENQGQTD